jgi:hypothetical protein
VSWAVSDYHPPALATLELYDPSEMVGLQLAAVVNLPARRIAGRDFDAVVLAVADPLGERTLLISERPVPDGARIAP